MVCIYNNIDCKYIVNIISGWYDSLGTGCPNQKYPLQNHKIEIEHPHLPWWLA